MYTKFSVEIHRKVVASNAKMWLLIIREDPGWGSARGSLGVKKAQSTSDEAEVCGLALAVCDVDLDLQWMGTCTGRMIVVLWP